MLSGVRYHKEKRKNETPETRREGRFCTLAEGDRRGITGGRARREGRDI